MRPKISESAASQACLPRLPAIANQGWLHDKLIALSSSWKAGKLSVNLMVLLCLQVAGKLGVKSLLGQTLAESADNMQLGVASVEAVGQHNQYTSSPGVSHAADTLVLPAGGEQAGREVAARPDSGGECGLHAAGRGLS